MPYYTYPNFTASTNPVIQLFQYADNVTTGVFSPFFLMAIFSISFLSLRNFGNNKAITASLFFTTILSWFFFISGISSQYVALVPTVLFFLSFFMKDEV